jgi:hypothetical protein
MEALLLVAERGGPRQPATPAARSGALMSGCISIGEREARRVSTIRSLAARGRLLVTWRSTFLWANSGSRHLTAQSAHLSLNFRIGGCHEIEVDWVVCAAAISFYRAVSSANATVYDLPTA